MNWKFILYSVVLVAVGAAIGGFGTKTYFDPEYQQANKTIDSLIAVDIERKSNFEKVLRLPVQKVNERRKSIQNRNENFKNDTIMPTDDELIQRARAAVGND